MQSANSRPSLQYSVHPCIGKNTNRVNIAHNWVVRRSDDISAALHYLTTMGNGFSWGTFQGGHRKGANLLRLDGIGLDIDNAGDCPYFSAQDAHADPILGRAWIAYPSPSFKPEHHKFRLLFKLPKPVFDRDGFHEAKAQLLKLMDLYPQLDRACKDVSRLWYGSPNTSALFTNEDDGVLPIELIEQHHAAWLEANPEAHKSSLSLGLTKYTEVAADENEGYCPAFDGYFRNDPALVQHVMGVRLVKPFMGRSTSTYQDARPFLYGCVAWLGPKRTAEIVSFTDWVWEERDVYQEIENCYEDLEFDHKPRAAIFNGVLKHRVKSELCDLTWNHINSFARGGRRYGL